MKRLFRLFLLLIGLLIAVLTYNTLNFTSKQITRPEVTFDPLPDDVCQRLSKAIKIQSISYEEQPLDTAAFLAFLNLLDTSYPLVDSLLTQQPGTGLSRVYKWPGKNASLKPILLMAHYDVVPAEEATLKDWQEAPFSGKIDDNYIWGRGSMDDKNSVLAPLEAAEILLSEGYEPERTIYFAFGHDEEIGGSDGAVMLAAIFKNQGIEFEYVLDEGSMVIEGGMPGMDKPVGYIGLAEKGYVTLKVTARGQAGHSSMPPKQTTIGLLSEGLTKLEKNPMPSRIDGPLKEMFEYAGPEMKFPFNVLFANLWLFEGMVKKQLSQQPASNALLHTTSAITVVEGGVKDNVMPGSAYALINFRIRPGNNVEDVIEYVQKTMDSDQISVEVHGETTNNPSAVSSTISFGFQVLQTTSKEIFPEADVVPSLVIATTDSRHYSLVSENVYRFMPVQVTLDEVKGIHGVNERISIKNYKRSIRFYQQLFKNSCQ